jgi:hypothetical protein
MSSELMTNRKNVVCVFFAAFAVSGGLYYFPLQQTMNAAAGTTMNAAAGKVAKN